MDDDTHYAERAARLLRSRPLATESRVSRDAGVSVVAQAIALRRRRVARWTMGGALLAVAAGVSLLVVVPRAGGEAQATGVGAPTGVQGPVRHGLSRGESVAALPGQAASVVLATGTRITVDDGGALECREDAATQRFAVLHGRAHLAVAKLHAGQRFLVDTPSAELEVHGTAFSVRVDAATPTCATRTSVEVEEGVVEVRSAGGKLFLHPGDRWANGCGEPGAASAPAEPPSVTAAANAPAPGPAQHRARAATHSLETSPNVPEPPAATPPAAATSVPVSSLSEQNDLYARAQAATSAGRVDEALAAYARLLTLFPRSQLAESAGAQRVRLLGARDPAAARVEARAYLMRFPNGFARREMESLAKGP